MVDLPYHQKMLSLQFYILYDGSGGTALDDANLTILYVLYASTSGLGMFVGVLDGACVWSLVGVMERD